MIATINILKDIICNANNLVQELYMVDNNTLYIEVTSPGPKLLIMKRFDRFIL